MAEAKKRFDFIDVFYALSIFLVVLGHSHHSDWSMIRGTGYDIFTNYLYSFHMSLFFFIAGFLFENSRSLDRQGYLKWIGNKALRLLTPYFVLSLIAAIPKFYIQNHTFNGILNNLVEIITVPRIGVWGHFWFIPVIFVVYLFFGLLKVIFREHKAVFFMISLIVSAVLFFIPFESTLFAFNDIKDSALYFVVGFIFYDLLKSIQDKINLNNEARAMLACVCTALSSILYLLWSDVRAVILCIGLLMITAVWNTSKVIDKNKIAAWVSKHNFTIYIYSWLFQAATMTVLGRLGFAWYLIAFAMLIAGLAGPVLIILIYEKLPKIHNRFFDLVLGYR